MNNNENKKAIDNKVLIAILVVAVIALVVFICLAVKSANDKSETTTQTTTTAPAETTEDSKNSTNSKIYMYSGEDFGGEPDISFELKGITDSWAEKIIVYHYETPEQEEDEYEDLEEGEEFEKETTTAKPVRVKDNTFIRIHYETSERDIDGYLMRITTPNGNERDYVLPIDAEYAYYDVNELVSPQIDVKTYKGMLDSLCFYSDWTTINTDHFNKTVYVTAEEFNDIIGNDFYIE